MSKAKELMMLFEDSEQLEIFKKGLAEINVYIVDINSIVAQLSKLNDPELEEKIKRLSELNVWLADLSSVVAQLSH